MFRLLGTFGRTRFVTSGPMLLAQADDFAVSNFMARAIDALAVA